MYFNLTTWIVFPIIQIKKCYLNIYFSLYMILNLLHWAIKIKFLTQNKLLNIIK